MDYTLLTYYLNTLIIRFQYNYLNSVIRFVYVPLFVSRIAIVGTKFSKLNFFTFQTRIAILRLSSSDIIRRFNFYFLRVSIKYNKILQNDSNYCNA